jgi:hypothetical protein
MEKCTYTNIFSMIQCKEVERDASLLVNGVDEISLSPRIAPPFLPTPPLNNSLLLSYSLLYSPLLLSSIQLP